MAAPAEPRITADLIIRKVSLETLARFRRQAAARGLTHEQYLARLMELQQQVGWAAAHLDMGPVEL